MLSGVVGKIIADSQLGAHVLGGESEFSAKIANTCKLCQQRCEPGGGLDAVTAVLERSVTQIRDSS